MTVVGGVIGLYAIVHPETIAAYLDRISGDVSAISDSIPRWPVIHEIAYVAQKPVSANISVVVSNPRNVLVENFAAIAFLKLPHGIEAVRLKGAKLIPPNENIRLSSNIIRSQWFPRLDESASVEAKFCFSGVLEGRDETFFETRRYLLSPGASRLELLGREFSLEDRDDCQLK